MKITRCQESTCYYLTIKNIPDWEFWTEYRRSSSGNWEVLMGMSWEEICNNEVESALEEAFVDFMS